MREEREDSRIDDHGFVLMIYAMFAAFLDLEEGDFGLGLMRCLPFLGLVVFCWEKM